MDKALFFSLVLVCVITHMVRTVYEIFKYKKIIHPGKISFMIILTNMLLLWMSWFLQCSHDIYLINIPDIIRYSGLFLFGMGILIFLVALFTIKTLESYEGDLITYGIYSRIRHPMYLAFILWIIGFPIFYGALYSSILTPFYIGNILYWRYLEEKELVNRFPGYLDYKKNTIF
jgi:protein-S-isoprenylcysteine O-methyltransferase Ste14